MSNNKKFNSAELAKSFKALSNPSRLQIFLRLLSCCEPNTRSSVETVSRICVGKLGRNLAVAPSTLSHHIKELVHAGLIKTQRHGQNIECYIDMEKVDILKAFFNGQVSHHDLAN